MDSPEGRGIARARWEETREGQSGSRAADVGLNRLERWAAAPVVLDLAGFWVMWHLRGGFEGLREMGLSRSSIYRRVSNFRKATGVPDEDIQRFSRHEDPDGALRPPPMDEYGIGAQILADLGLSSIRILTDHPKGSITGLDGFGLEIVEQVPLTVEGTPSG